MTTAGIAPAAAGDAGVLMRSEREPAAPAPGESPPPRQRYAAIDLGTHNCRLLIAEAGDGGRLRIVGALSRAVRLGEGVAATGRLGEGAMARAMAALERCEERLRDAGVGHCRAVATEACRQASNGQEFLDRVHERTSLVLEPISAEEECRLTLAGCLPVLDPGYAQVLLFDIGGGSTEVVWADLDTEGLPRPIAYRSIRCGVVSFSERFGGDAINAETFATMVALIDRELSEFDQDQAIAAAVADGCVQVVGTSGTVTTLAAVALGLKRYRRSRVDGLRIPFETITAISDRLSRSSWVERAALPCVGPERADLVVAGCAILTAICRRWPAERLTVADRGIREGLLFGMLNATPMAAGTREAER